MKQLFEKSFEETCMPPAVDREGNRLLVPVRQELHLFNVLENGQLADAGVLPIPLETIAQGQTRAETFQDALVVILDNEKAVKLINWTAYMGAGVGLEPTTFGL